MRSSKTDARCVPLTLVRHTLHEELGAISLEEELGALDNDGIDGRVNTGEEGRCGGRDSDAPHGYCYIEVERTGNVVKFVLVDVLRREAALDEQVGANARSQDAKE